MSLYDDASLIAYPSGYKESKIYAQKPVSGTGDLTFARASSATRVNAEGLIETVPYNLINYSQDFTNGVWTPNGVVATLNSGTAPDGTNTLNDVSSDNSGVQENRFRYATSLSVSTTYTISIFCKVKDINNFYIRDLTGGGGVSIINVATSTALVTGSGSTISIVDFGSGIKRVIITFTTPSSIGNNLIDFGITSSNTDRQSAIAIGSGMYFWGAMINEGSSAKTYQKTESGLNIPRIDYTGGGCGKLLLEPQRTNAVVNSNSNFVINSSTIDYNNATSPEGVVNAYKATATGTSGTFVRTANASISDPSAFSVFFKKGNNQWLQIMAAAVTGHYVNVDIENGVFGTSGSDTSDLLAEDYGNGWYRISGKFSGYSGNTTLRIYMGNSSSSGWAGTTAVIGDYYYGYGFQIEAGSYPTSYIPTSSGTTVTRIRDTSITSGLSSIINSVEGVIFLEMAALANDSTNRYISINNGTSSKRIIFKFGTSSNNIAALGLGTASSFSMSYSGATITNMNKIALKYKANDCALWVNGVEVATDSTFTAYAASTLTNIGFSNVSGGGQWLEAKVQNLQIFPTALDDATLATLTTL